MTSFQVLVFEEVEVQRQLALEARANHLHGYHNDSILIQPRYAKIDGAPQKSSFTDVLCSDFPTQGFIMVAQGCGSCPTTVSGGQA